MRACDRGDFVATSQTVSPVTRLSAASPSVFLVFLPLVPFSPSSPGGPGVASIMCWHYITRGAFSNKELMSHSVALSSSVGTVMAVTPSVSCRHVISSNCLVTSSHPWKRVGADVMQACKHELDEWCCYLIWYIVVQELTSLAVMGKPSFDCDSRTDFHHKCNIAQCVFRCSGLCCFCLCDVAAQTSHAATVLCHEGKYSVARKPSTAFGSLQESSPAVSQEFCVHSINKRLTQPSVNRCKSLPQSLPSSAFLSSLCLPAAATPCPGGTEGLWSESGGGAGTTTGVLASSLLLSRVMISLACHLPGGGKKEKEEKKKKTHPQQKQCLKMDLPASALKDYFLLSVFIHRQTLHLCPVSLFPLPGV